MKKRRVSALILSLALALGISLPASADDGETQFIYRGISTPVSVTHNLNNSYRHNGTGNKAVHYYGYTRSAENYTNDAFASGYNYMSYGTGSPMYDYNLNNFSATFANDFSEMKSGDAIYYSFYYRSHSSFTGAADGKNYTGEETKPAVILNGKTRVFNELSTGVTSSASAAPTFTADDKWHRAEFYIPVTDEIKALANFQFGISFFEMDKAYSIDISGFNYGLLSVESGFDKSNDAYYTYIAEALNKPVLGNVSVDGKNVTLKDGVLEYTADASDITAVVDAAPLGKEKSPDVTKIDDFTYEIKFYANGYDEIDDSERAYLKKTDADGIYSADGTVERYKVTNDDKFSVLKLNLRVKPAAISVTVNGAAAGLPYSCADGAEITLDCTFNNYYSEDYTYITLLVIKDGDRVLQIVPFETKLGANEIGKAETFMHTADLKGAASGELDVFVLNKNNLCEVYK